jgi:surface antigen
LATVGQKLRSVGFLLALSSLLTMGLSVATTSPVSAAGASSTLCSGYVLCGQGSFSTHGYQASSGNSYWTMYPGDNCTNYVAFVESTVYGIQTPTFDLGDGGLWASAAAQNGVLVNHTPTVGSVAVWTGASSGIPAEGHVAIVEAVGPLNSYIVISQQHMLDDANGYDWTVIYPTPSQNQWENWPNDFIHFSTAPSTNGPQALTSAALAMTANIVVRVSPISFANDNLTFTSRSPRVVVPGVVTSLNAGGLLGEYQITFQKSSLADSYVLHLSVSGPNVRILHQGGPYTNDLPTLRVTGSSTSQTPSVVTLTLQRGKSTPTTTTTTVPSTTTTTTTLPAVSASMTSWTAGPALRTNINLTLP